MTSRKIYQRAYYREFFRATIKPRTCACGCGETFTPKTRQGMYVNRTHKCRVHNRLARPS